MQAHGAPDIEMCQYVPVTVSSPTAAAVEAVACCPPLDRAPLTAEQAELISPLLKALADPVRLRLLSLVAAHPGGEACACDLQEAFALSQPTISHHLKVLVDAGLLHREKRGVWAYHRLEPSVLADLATLLGGVGGGVGTPAGGPVGGGA